MSTQQTVLRALVNNANYANASTTGSGITNLTYDIAYPNGSDGDITITGDGSAYNPYVGNIKDITGSGFQSFQITFNNLGTSGELYYEFTLPTYTGTSIDFYQTYYFEMQPFYPNKKNGQAGFIEYAVSDINNSIYIQSGTSIQFTGFLESVSDAVGVDFKVYFIPGSYLPLTGTTPYFVANYVVNDTFKQYQYLDTTADIPIKITKSFAEIQDIGSRNSDYSLGLTLPGTKTNNKFFENFFNTDQTTLFFDPTHRVPIDVLIDDEPYFRGYMKLNKVSVLESEIEYDVTLFSDVANLFGNIGNNLLKDLDFDDIDFHFNHYFTMYNVGAAWSDNQLLNGKPVPNLWFYPVVHNGYEYSGDLVNWTGSTNLQNVTRLYTPTTGGTFADYTAFQNAGGKEGRINSPINALIDNQLKPALNIWGLIQLIFKTYGFTIKSEFFNTPWFKLLYTYGFYSASTTKLSFNLSQIKSLTQSASYLIFIPFNTDSNGNEIYTGDAYQNFKFIIVDKNGIPSYCITDLYVDIHIRRDYKNDLGFELTTHYDQTYKIDAYTSGTTVNLQQKDGNTIARYWDGINSTPVTLLPSSTLKYSPTAINTSVPIFEYGYVNFNQIIGTEIKQIDILSSIAKKFNLVFVPDPNVPKQIIIEPYDYYIGSGNIYDWTEKLSFDKGYSVEPAINYTESQLYISDLEDGDDGNKQFKDRNNRIYGRNLVYNPTDFKSQEKKIETIFSPEIIRNWDSEGQIGIPLGINYAAATESQQNGNSENVNYFYKGAKTKPKLFYYGGNGTPFINQVGKIYDTTNNINTIYFRLNQSDGTNPLNGEFATEFQNAPIISHTIPIGNVDSNKINNDSISILFNSETPADFGLGLPSFNAYTINNAYNLFYANRLNNIYNKNTRFLSGNFYLKLSDVKNLTPKDLIKVGNQYFTWNKLDGYNLTNKELTKVELIQANNNPNQYPERFFVYNYCQTNYYYKFKTTFQNDGSQFLSFNNSLFYWSLMFDYFVGAIGYNTKTITSTFPVNGGTQRIPYTMSEITQAQYYDDTYITSLTHTDDPYDSSFISQTDRGLPKLYQNNQTIWAYTPNGYENKNVLLNVAQDYLTMSGYCASANITLTTATGSTITPTPTPTPTATPIPVTTPMIGSLLLDLNQINHQYGSVSIFVNSVQRNLTYSNINGLYSTYLYQGDTVNITLNTDSIQNTIDVIRKDYTNYDENGDRGIKETIVDSISGSTTYVTFTVPTLPSDYNFEYILGISMYYPISTACDWIGTTITWTQDSNNWNTCQ